MTPDRYAELLAEVDAAIADPDTRPEWARLVDRDEWLAGLHSQRRHLVRSAAHDRKVAARLAELAP